MFPSAKMDVLLEKLVFMPKARRALIEEGIDSVESLSLFTEREIRDLIQNIIKITSSRKSSERVIIRAVNTKRLLAVKEISRRHKLCASVLNVEEITCDEADSEAVKMSNINQDELQDDDNQIPMPKFTGNNWFGFKKAFLNKVAGIRGGAGVFLTYIVRDKEAPNSVGFSEMKMKR